MAQIDYLETSFSLADFTERLRLEAAVRHGVPDSLSEQAAGITLRRFEREMNGGQLSARTCSRLRAYFYAVVRRRAVGSRSPELRELRSRLLLSSLAADLEDTGRTGREIFVEIAQDYAGHVDPSALQALEVALCG